jgi:hypothetical protein
MSKIKNNSIRSCTQPPASIKKDCISWLERIGVDPMQVEFDYEMYEKDKPWAEVYFRLGVQNYKFRSDKQDNFKLNLKAIELFLHNRVISIERGIEETNQAFAGYKQIGNGSSTGYVAQPHGHFIGCNNLKEVEAVYKAKTKLLHPDVGGSSNLFAELKDQYDLAKKYYTGFRA